MQKGDKVKISGTRFTGIIDELYSERNKPQLGSISKVLLAKVKHDEDGRVVEYVINELRKMDKSVCLKTCLKLVI